MRDGLRRYIGRKVVAHLADTSISGTLTDVGGNIVILTDSQILIARPDGRVDREPVDGLTVIDRPKVDRVQVLP